MYKTPPLACSATYVPSEMVSLLKKSEDEYIDLVGFAEDQTALLTLTTPP